MFGLSEKIYKDIIDITKMYECKFILFGSRARGDYKENSDIDIAVEGNINEKMEYSIRNKFDLLNIPYTIDIIFLSKETKEELQEAIKKEGVEL